MVVKRGTLLKKPVPLHSLPWYTTYFINSSEGSDVVVSVCSQADVLVQCLVGGPVPDRGMKHGWYCPRPWDEDVQSQNVG